MNMYNALYKPLLFCAYTNAGLLLTTMCYLITGFYKDLSLILIALTICLISITSEICYFASSTAGESKYLSSQVCSSYLRNNLQLGKSDEKCFKSCRPLYMQIGNVAKLDRTTFVLLMHEIVVVNVVNLLVMSKK